MLKWLWLSAIIVVLDQVSKVMADTMLILYQPLPVLPWFNLTLMYNTGAAFSFLADAGGWQRWFFLILSSVISVILVFWLARLQTHQRLQALALALVLGGAIGNIIDRILYGHVVDFIQIYYDRWSWPAFNLADSAITVGAVLLIAESFFAARETRVEQAE